MILLLNAGVLFPDRAAAQDFQWVKTMGAGTVDAALSVKTDGSGNCYTTGIFSATVDFDPGPGIYELTSAGNEDIFITKLDASGNLVWARSIGGVNTDFGTSLSLDASGNVCITGNFSGTVDFDPGSGTCLITSIGAINTYVCKLDAQGDFVWAKALGGSFQNSANSISIDASGDILVAGSFFETVDFDPGAGIHEETSVGGQDIFILKLDASGNFIRVKTMGGTSDDFPLSIAIDAVANIYTCGAFQETCDFDPGTGISNLSSNGVEDVFILKLDSAGNLIWVKGLGSESYDEAQSIATDPAGNLLVTGFFSLTVDFDPGPEVFNLSTPGDVHDYDIYILKLDASGDFTWAKSIFAPNFNEGRSLTVDASGKIYSTGTYQGASDFDPGAGTFNLTPTGSEEMYLHILDADGNFVWAGAMAGNSAGTSVTLDASGFVYTTGYFGEGSCDFDPGPGSFNVTANGMTDIFTAKFSQVALGIKPILRQDDVTLSPNPTGGIFTLSSPGNCGRFKLCNLTGEVIREYDGRKLSQEGNLVINIRDLPDGIYLIQWDDGRKICNRKIVLQK
ncbi:MAG: T9SS type A sorting domain-containing protein [Bacteroidales bacterium]